MWYLPCGHLQNFIVGGSLLPSEMSGDCFLEKLEPSFAEPKDEDGQTLITLRNKGLIGPDSGNSMDTKPFRRPYFLGGYVRRGQVD